MKIDGEKFLEYMIRTNEIGKGISDRHLYVADRIEEYGFNKRLSMVVSVLSYVIMLMHCFIVLTIANNAVESGDIHYGVYGLIVLMMFLVLPLLRHLGVFYVSYVTRELPVKQRISCVSLSNKVSYHEAYYTELFEDADK